MTKLSRNAGKIKKKIRKAGRRKRKKSPIVIDEGRQSDFK